MIPSAHIFECSLCHIPVDAANPDLFRRNSDKKQMIDCPNCGFYFLATEIRSHLEQRDGKLRMIIGEYIRNRDPSSRLYDVYETETYIAFHSDEEAIMEKLSRQDTARTMQNSRKYLTRTTFGRPSIPTIETSIALANVKIVNGKTVKGVFKQ